MVLFGSLIGFRTSVLLLLNPTRLAADLLDCLTVILLRSSGEIVDVTGRLFYPGTVQSDTYNSKPVGFRNEHLVNHKIPRWFSTRIRAAEKKMRLYRRQCKANFFPHLHIAFTQVYNLWCKSSILAPFTTRRMSSAYRKCVEMSCIATRNSVTNNTYPCYRPFPSLCSLDMYPPIDI